jgi:hypothetical protein
MKFYKINFFSCLHHVDWLSCCVVLLFMLGAILSPFFCVGTNSNVITFSGTQIVKMHLCWQQKTTNILHGTLNISVDVTCLQ